MPVIDVTLASALVEEQFPEWAALSVRPVVPGGWDNRTFRLGADMLLRLPSREAYAAQVEKEQRWLPRLARCLPLPIPVPLAVGAPGCGYPWPWSVYRWLPGAPVRAGAWRDAAAFGHALGEFLVALRSCDATDGPPPGAHNFFRGASPAVYDRETREALRAAEGRIDTRPLGQIWEAALAAEGAQAAVWAHGDVAQDNLLLVDGALSAVIDFGCMAVGDPACDTVIAWTLLPNEGRRAFRAALDVDGGTWARGRGWAVWKALITFVGGDADQARAAERTLAAVVADWQAEGG